MKVTPDVFAHLTHYLKGLANGKVMVLLEVRSVFLWNFFKRLFILRVVTVLIL